MLKISTGLPWKFWILCFEYWIKLGMFNIEYLWAKMQFLDSKYQMNRLEKSLKFKYIAVLWLYTLLHL